MTKKGKEKEGKLKKKERDRLRGEEGERGKKCMAVAAHDML